MRPLVLLLSFCTVATLAEEVADKPSPKQAWEKMQADLAAARSARDSTGMRRILAERPGEFLAEWKAGGETASGEAALFVGQFQAAAKRHADAAKSFLAALRTEGIEEAQADDAASRYLGATVAAFTEGQADEAALRAAIAVGAERAAAASDEARSQMRANLRYGVGNGHQQLGETDKALASWKECALARPAAAYGMANRSLLALVRPGLGNEDYDALRERAAAVVGEYTEIQSAYVASLEESGDRALPRAKAMLARIPSLGKPLELLGRPAPEWTLVKAYRGQEKLAGYRGKVVMIDFWATWCPWCIKSFPALRDLQKHYAGKDFVIVGATASSGRVWEARYDLDDDLAAKAPPGPNPPTITMERGADEAAQAEFRAREKEVIATFIENHGMSWDVVQIDPGEPAAKYALQGWPFALVIDKTGNVRYLKSGALLRERPGDVKKLHAVIDALLAE